MLASGSRCRATTQRGELSSRGSPRVRAVRPRRVSPGRGPRASRAVRPFTPRFSFRACAV
eukprot:11536364-Alexandrium_andersonii.AAC.1